MQSHNALLGVTVDPTSGAGLDVPKRMQRFINGSTVMLFIKGTADQPMCGFSARVIDVFNRVGKPYATFNILDDPEIRNGAKEFSSWPTFPQIYVGGEFVVGCDIGLELYANGELETLVNEAVDAKGLGPLHSEAATEKPAPRSLLSEKSKATGEGLAEARELSPAKLELLGLENFIVIDVRADEERAANALQGVRAASMGELAALSHELPADHNVLFVAEESKRGLRAADFLVARGHRHVFYLKGGLEGWTAQKGKPLVG